MVKMEGGLQELYKAFDRGKAEEIEKCINDCLRESISFMDGGNTEEQKESSYHTLLIGMAKGRKGWIVKSNREAGGGAHREAILNGTAELARATPGVRADTRGRADIILINRMKQEGIMIEVKHTSDERKLQAKAEEACRQIKDMDYNEYFLGFQINKIEEYGIAFCRKTCKVLKK
ncbi:MAG: PD-(D/E)XK nuclease domain-containing protein [Lachnospiraceae bacterium]|nr:PD-(D/E)XK nuclease domain-containing protein [Lachnospiraceae bacterium]